MVLLWLVSVNNYIYYLTYLMTSSTLLVAVFIFYKKKLKKTNFEKVENMLSLFSKSNCTATLFYKRMLKLILYQKKLWVFIDFALPFIPVMDFKNLNFKAFYKHMPVVISTRH